MTAHLRKEKERSLENVLSRSTSSETRHVNYSNILFSYFTICLQSW